MTDKELRKLRRDDLLQILINQQRQIDELNEKLAKSKAALERRDIAIREAGSVAEAALKLNGVFEAAQAAADQYEAQMRANADEVRAKAEAESEKAKRIADDVVRSARSEADRILREARAEAERVKAEAGVRPAEPAAPMGEAPQAEEGRPRKGLLWRNRKA